MEQGECLMRRKVDLIYFLRSGERREFMYNAVLPCIVGTSFNGVDLTTRVYIVHVSSITAEA